MKQSLKRVAPIAVGLATLAPAAQAFAQYEGDEGAALGAVCGFYACLGIFGLASIAFWVWMLIDLIQRQEYEFPNSQGNSKTIWLVVMGVGFFVAPLIAAVVYYFMVYKKVKRGSLTAPAQGAAYAPRLGPGP